MFKSINNFIDQWLNGPKSIQASLCICYFCWRQLEERALKRFLQSPLWEIERILSVYVKTIPVPVTRKLLDLGRKRYDITCGTCHGPLGDGDSIVARQMALHPPPSLHRYIDKPAGYIFEVATKGFGMMASYAAELTVEERWAVVAYIRALQLSQNTPAAELPGDVRQRLESLPATGAAPAPAAPAPHHQEKQ